MPRTSLALNQNVYGLYVNRVYRNDDGTLYTWGEQIKRDCNYAKSRDTVNTPDYRKKKSLGQLPMNPFSYTETFNDEIKGTYDWYEKSPSGLNGHQRGPLYYLGYSVPSGLTQSERDAVNANALNGSLKDLKAMKVNLGNVLGERKQTVNMILGTAQRIGDSLRALRKGNFRNAAIALGARPGRRKNGVQLPQKPSKALADEWLALQFGWKPLLHDVYNAAEDLARLQNEPRRFSITSSKTKRWDKRTHGEDRWQGVPVTVVSKGSYTRKYVYVFSYRNVVIADLSRFGATNPASVAWELTPWSFVVDWFIPIGDYIDAWDATAGYEFEKGCTTTFIKYHTQATSNGAVQTGDRVDVMNARGSQTVVSCVRTVLSNFPSPVIPSFRDPMTSITRGVTVAALLRQRLKL